MNFRFLLGVLLSLLSSVAASAFNFSVSTLQGATFSSLTGLQFGPDNRLYVLQTSGQLKILTVQRTAPNSYKVTATELVNLVRDLPNYNDDGTRNTTLTTRQATGLLVVGTATNPVVYVSSSDPRIGGGSGGYNDTNLDTNSGIISRLTWNGTAWSKVDLVRGLPRSEENHATNGLQLDPTSNVLYVAQGGNTNAGSPSVNFAYACETALAGAILSVDLNAINAMPVKVDANGQQYLYDLPTIDDPNPNRAHNSDGSNVNDPFGGNNGMNQARLVPGGPVQIYASGFRNPYDLVLTKTAGAAGRLYAFDNGANPGWGGYPQSVNTPSVTNQYVSGEPGYVNNLDSLHFITRGYYAGHPNPIRANPTGAGWLHFDASLPAGSQLVYSTNPTSDWPPVPSAMANPIEANYLQPGPANHALLTNTYSTNGITEYVANNFNGGMKGNLIAASYNGNNLLRIALSADGTTVTNGLELLASGFGSQPLDVTAPDPAHGAPFLGTIWVAHYSPAKITILEPADFDNPNGSTCTGVNSFDVDEDGDGYSNADEIANGTDPCNAASRPADWDGDHISDLLDSDDDNDGIADVQDPFPLDTTNGKAVPHTVHYELFNATGVGFYGVGMTGLMMNRGQDYLPLITPDNAVAGGTAGLFTLSQVGAGTPRGSTNTQKDAYQFAYNSDSFSPPYVVTSRLAGPFFNSAPTGNQTQGIYLGYGDQDNYVSLALHGNGGAGGIEVVYEVAGTITFDQIYPLAGLDQLGNVDLSFAVDPIAGTVQPRYQIPGQSLVPLGSPITTGGDVLMAIMGKYPLAIGLFANTGGGSTPTFTATWDWFDVAAQTSTALAKLTIDPKSTNMATASTYANGSFAIQNLSTGGQQIETVSFDLSTAMLPDMVFDVTGTAGDNVFKVFTPNTVSAGVSLNAGVMTHPHNGTSADDGYDGVDVNFNAFPTNGTFSFSIDVDPNSVKGVAQPGEHDSASVSGLDLIGTTATVYFSDGSVQRTRVGRVENSVSGAYGWARSDAPPKPGIAVLGLTPPVTTGTAAQTVRVSGPAGLNVSLVRAESGLYLGGVPGGGYNVHPYDANTVVAVTETDSVIGSAGYVDIPVTLTKTDTKSGYNFFTATLADSAGIKSPASDAVEVLYDPSLGGDTQPPTQPGTLSFTSVTSSSVTVNWTASTDNVGVTSYRVSRGTTVLGTTSGLSYTDTGLAPSTSYTYSVVALDAAGNASPATAGTVSTVSAVLPTTIRINAGGPSYADANSNTWSADNGYNTGATTTYTTTVTGTTDPTLFKTERYDANTAPELQYTLGIQNGSYTVRLYFAETYAGSQSVGARVFDVNVQGQLAFANVDIYAQAGANKALVLTAPATVTNNQITIQFIHKVQNPKINAIEIVPSTGSDTTPPTAPTSLTASNITATSLTLNWNASTDNVGVTGYKVYRDNALLATVTSTTYADSGLSASTAYNYSVIAIDAAGNTSPAASLTATTVTGSDTQPPSAPGALSFSNVTATSVTLSWGASTDNVGVTGYQITRGATVLTTVNALTYTDSGLTPSTAYSYSVVAVDAAGNTSPATSGSTTTASTSSGTAIRINAGGPAYVDGNGNTWAADNGYNTGSLASSTVTVSGTSDPTLFKTERYDPPATPELLYTLSAPNGSYTVKLYFAETYAATQGAGLRVFDINIQSQPAFTGVDIYSQAGGANKALVLSAPATVSNGKLTIQFIHKVENPKINAIEIIPTTAADSTPPTAPTSLSASSVTATSLTLNWTASTDNVGVTGYRVSRGGTLLTTVTGTTFNDSGLSPNTAYAYSVVAVDAANNASTAATLNVTTAAASDTTPPSAPGALSFSNVTATSVTLSWGASTDNVGVTGYKITRGTTVVSTVNALTYTDSGLTPTTAYSYSVVAVDAAGNTSAATSGSTTTASASSGTTIRINAGGPAYVDGNGNTWAADNGYNTGSLASSTVTVSGTSDPTLFKTERYDPPATPELLYTLSAPNGSYTVKLYFAETYAATQGAGLRVFDINIQSQPSFTGVDIYSQAGGANKALVLSAPATVSNGKLTIQFIHKVENPKINAIEIIPSTTSDTTAPTAPTSLTASNVAATSLTLSWTASSDNVGVTGYRVSRGGTLLTTVTGTTFNDSGLSPNTAYAYSVVAIDAANNASTAATVNVTTAAATDTTPPSAPTGLASSNVTSASLTLTWTASTDDVGVTGYRVSRDGTLLTTVTGTSFNDSGLSANTAYAYSVVAIDAANNTSAAATLNVTTAPAADTTPPSAPTGLASSNVTSTGVTLTWAASTDNVGVTGYRVSRDGTLLTTVTGTSFNDSGLSPNTAYAYSVVAIDAANNSSTAATLNVTTAGAVYALRINAGGPAYVDKNSNTWVADTGYNTGKVSTEAGTVNGTTDPQLFKTVRFDDTTAPELMYTLGVPNGSYRVRLYFAETNSSLSAVGKRVFDVNVQSQLAFPGVDIYAQAGGAWQALILETTASVTNGQLQIQFIHKVNNPRINAIEILSP